MGLTQVNSEGIKDGEIKDADVNASAAIAGSKLAAATTSAAGSMSAADKTKLDGVATSATANPSAPALTGSTNNTITTVTGANAIQGEANLTFDGSDLALSRSDNAAGGISVTNTNDAQASGIAQLALSGGDNSYANISLEAGGNNHHIKNDNSGNLYILDGATNRLQIDSSGNVKVSDGDLVIGTSGHGIDFSATSGTGTSELFDDYEEGTWTPTFSAGGGGSDAWDTKVGKYTKVGRKVTCMFSCQSYSGSASLSGDITMSGLPFTNSQRQYVGDYGIYNMDLPASASGGHMIFINNNTSWYLYFDVDNANSIIFNSAHLKTGSYFEGNLTYIV